MQTFHNSDKINYYYYQFNWNFNFFAFKNLRHVSLSLPLHEKILSPHITDSTFKHSTFNSTKQLSTLLYYQNFLIQIYFLIPIFPNIHQHALHYYNHEKFTIQLLFSKSNSHKTSQSLLNAKIQIIRKQRCN